MRTPSDRIKNTPGRCCSRLALACVLLLAGQVNGQSSDPGRILQRLTDERLVLTAELDQYRKTLAMLQIDGTPPEESSNPAIRKLAMEAVELKKRLIAITEQEVTLLQQQIIDTGDHTKAPAVPGAPALASASAEPGPGPGEAIESEPARTASVEDTRQRDTENVARLHRLLETYFGELQESARILPTPEELTLRELAKREAETLDKIPFSFDKVRLNGSEGSTALAQISQRLVDPGVPESRRDIAPICIIKTRLLDTLVGSENRSLKPVGKNHYIARVRLQPGDTTISILSHEWEVQLPQHASARDYLITLYRPVDGTPELHVFAVDDLLATDKPHIPAWLPAELELKTSTAG